MRPSTLATLAHKIGPVSRSRPDQHRAILEQSRFKGSVWLISAASMERLGMYLISHMLSEI